MCAFTFTRQPDGIGLLEISDELTIVHASDLHGALSDCGAGVSTLEIRCANLTRLDAAALQLLVAAAARADRAHVVAPPAAWSGAFSRYGLPDPFSIQA